MSNENTQNASPRSLMNDLNELRAQARQSLKGAKDFTRDRWQRMERRANELEALVEERGDALKETSRAQLTEMVRAVRAILNNEDVDDVSLVMSRDVATTGPSATLAQAATEMREKDCGALPVLNDEGQVQGMLTDRDICITVATKGTSLDVIRVEEAMTKSTRTCMAGDSLKLALERMANSKVRRLPVVDENQRLLGMIALGDIARRVVATPGKLTPQEVALALASISEPTPEPSEPAATS